MMMQSLMKLRHQARALWRDPTLQRKWLRAVVLARSTKQGWVLDTRVEKKA
jgi:hypothetical protein